MKCTHATFLLTAVLAVAAPALADDRPYGPIEVLILSGEPAPEFSPAATFGESGGGPVINNAGQVLVEFHLRAPDRTLKFDETLWLLNGHQRRLIATAEDPLPGGSGRDVIGAFSDLRLFNDGVILFKGFENGRQIRSDWVIENGVRTIFMRERQPAVGLGPDDVYASLEQSVLRSEDGVFAARPTLALSDGLSGSRVAPAVYAGTPGDWAPIGVAWDAAPGLSPEEFWTPRNVSITGSGSIFVHATLFGPAITDSNDSAIWQWNEGVYSLLAREGQPAPFLPPGASGVETLLVGPETNAAGDIALLFRAAGPGLAFPMNQFLVFGPPDNPAVIARGGQQAPGLPDGIVLEDLTGALAFFLPPRHVQTNKARSVLFTAALAGPGVTEANAESVWVHTKGIGTRLVARAGDRPPGFPADSFFSGFNAHWVADNGRIVLVGSVARQTGGLGRGIWATDAWGRLRPVIHRGTLIEVAPGDVRTVHQVHYASNRGYGTGARIMNNRGQIVIRVAFEDGAHALLRIEEDHRRSADHNGDNQVNSLDLLLFLDEWFSESTDADVTADGRIDTADLLQFLHNWMQAVA